MPEGAVEYVSSAGNLYCITLICSDFQNNSRAKYFQAIIHSKIIKKMHIFVFFLQVACDSVGIPYLNNTG